jgi:hypothetical protein
MCCGEVTRNEPVVKYVERVTDVEHHCLSSESSAPIVKSAERVNPQYRQPIGTSQPIRPSILVERTKIREHQLNWSDPPNKDRQAV